MTMNANSTSSTFTYNVLVTWDHHDPQRAMTTICSETYTVCSSSAEKALDEAKERYYRNVRTLAEFYENNDTGQYDEGKEFSIIEV